MARAKFRKKPVEIEAMHFADVSWSGVISSWCGGSNVKSPGEIQIPTLEGTMTAKVGDYVIRGVQGEFYPCKSDIFEATYEHVVEVNAEGAAEREAATSRATARFFTASNAIGVVALRDLIVALGTEIDLIVPAGRNKSLALTALEDVQMRGNRGIFADEANR